MQAVKVNFAKICGKIKPMHAVNNGPAGSRVRRTGNFEDYEKAKIPYARLHDASFYSGYGGEFSVDVHRIFPDFNADVNDPSSYIFQPTDNYLQGIKSVGTEIFYRLGASIEHGYKKGTYPPKDFLKWAQICEKIILHYNEGWANGFRMGITYWEIWNEPDCRNADGSNPCWQGTDEEFFTFYERASKYLKGKFPKLKIGGPAVCFWGSGFAEKFLAYAKANEIPLDFFSYHGYTNDLEKFRKLIENFNSLLRSYGYENTETVLNEWNYIRGWLDEEWKYSLRMEKGLKGSSFVTGAMCVGQETDLDMLMYYDARPSGMNGIFDTDTLTPLKTYYAIQAFSTLYKLGKCAKQEICGKDLYACSATDGEKESAILLTYYSDDDNSADKQVEIRVENLPQKGNTRVEFYRLNAQENMSLLRTEFCTGKECVLSVDMPIHTSYLIRFFTE